MKKLLLIAAVSLLATACTKDDGYFPAETKSPSAVTGNIFWTSESPYTYKPEEGMRFQKDILRR